MRSEESVRRDRRAFLRMIVLGSGAALLAACSQTQVPAAPTAPSAAPTTAAAQATTGAVASESASAARWDEVLAAARREGKVVIYGAPGTTYRQVYVDEFQKKFPEIKVDYQGANGSQQAPRLAAERQAGKFLADLYIGGATSPMRGLLPINALDPIEEAFILPEVRDKSLWFQNQYLYEDRAGKYVFAFAGNGEATSVVRNTRMLRENELTRWSELLDPKWKGKIVSGDPSVLGTTVGSIADVASDARYGMEFIKKLYDKEHGVVLTADGRQLMDWIAQGQYPIGIGVPEFQEAKDVGLPVEQQPLDVVTLSCGFAHIMLMNQPPNPNAAKVFINWLLGKEAQTLYQRITVLEPSLRMDVPRDGVRPDRVPDPKIKYTNTQHEDFLELRTDVAKVVQSLRA